MAFGICWLIWVWQVLRRLYPSGWCMWLTTGSSSLWASHHSSPAWLPSTTFQQWGGAVITQALELAQNPFCHIPFARKTTRGRETDSTSWWKAEEGCWSLILQDTHAFVLAVITNWNITCWVFHPRSVHELPGGKNVSMLHPVFCQNYVSYKHSSY